MEIRRAALPADLPQIERLWLEYLTWGNDQLDAHYGFRLPVREAIDGDLANIAKFLPPHGELLLVFRDEIAVGIGCLRKSLADTAEVKRMYVQEAARGAGVGRALLDGLVTAARAAGYTRLRLDSSNFMTAAHALYRSNGFSDVAPYPESEIPDQYKDRWVFMERAL